jgi:non-ribosomal peptide synthetase component F
MLAVYVAMMSRWCNEDDLVLTFVSHGRHGRPELANTIGFLATHLHIRVKVSEDDSFVDLLKRVNLELYSAYEHWDFDRVPELIPGCATELYFNWQSTNVGSSAINQHRKAHDSLRMQPFPLRVLWLPESPLPIFSDTAAGIAVTVWYRADLFAKQTIERFGHGLRSLAAEFVQQPLASVTSVAHYP